MEDKLSDGSQEKKDKQGETLSRSQHSRETGDGSCESENVMYLVATGYWTSLNFLNFPVAAPSNRSNTPVRNVCIQ